MEILLTSLVEAVAVPVVMVLMLLVLVLILYRLQVELVGMELDLQQHNWVVLLLQED